jgi:protein-S-isoprenylcysteine O-methyltransferase Ste14
MNKPEARDGARVRFPPPLTALAAILLGVALQRWFPLHPGFQVAPGVRHVVGGLVVLLPLLGLGLPGVLALRRTGQSEIPWTPTTEIVQRGPFRYSRNPMYLQMVLFCVGFAILLFNPWILLLTPLVAWALYRFAIRPEEEYLEAKFGTEYLAYKKRVRRWI